MKKKLLIGILPLAAASAAMGQVINFHDGANYAQVPGYAALYYGQGAYSDPGHNVWNGFGSGGSGPGSTLFYGGGNPWNAPAINPPNVFIATNNPGNPYAAWGNPPTFIATAGSTVFGQAGGEVDGGGNPTATPAGNAYSDGSYSPITLGMTCTALSPQRGTGPGAVQATPNWIFLESVLGNGSNPQVIATLSNVPPATYELYLYSASFGDNGGTLFTVNSGTPHNGIGATLNRGADGSPANVFVEGDDYVIFQNVVPDGNHVITITGSPNPLNGANGNLTGQADFNGLQLINTGPPPTLLIQSYTPAQNVYSGATAQFTVALQIGSSPSYKWQSIIGGVTNNLTDGGQILGSGTANLSISSVGAGNVGLYQCRVIAGGVTNVTPPAPLTILQSTAMNIVQRGDPATSYNDAIGAPPGNSAGDAVDGTLTSFINFGTSGNTTTFTGPAGFVITPQAGSTIVTGLRFIVASSHPEDDPADFLLEGSNDGGATFTTIASGALALPVERNLPGVAFNITSAILQEVTFANTSGYTTYRLSANNIRNNAGPTYGMQIGEVQMLGTYTPIAPGILQQPTSVATLFAGSTLAASVAPDGLPPYTYQWYFNGTTKITGATNPILSLPNVQLANAGNYSCVVSNTFGGTTSSNLALTVVTPNHYQQIVQALNPIGYWSLEETNGTTAWDYVGQHNGAYNGGFLQAQPGVPDASFVPTNTSYSVAFNGSTGYIDIPESATPVATNLVTGFVNYPTLTNLNILSPMTMIGWINSVGSGGFHTFFGHGDPSYRMDYDSGGDPHFADFNNDATGSTSVGDGKWHLIVGVYTGVSNICYVDGAFAKAAQTGGQGPGDSFDVWIGGDPQYGTGSSGRLFQGNIAQCALLNYALTSTQIFQIFNNAGALPEISLQTNAFFGDQNGSASITANPPVGSVPLFTQWWVVSGGVTNALAGQTNLTLTLTNLQPAQSGNQYFIVASNFFGLGASDIAGLIVFGGPPSIGPDLPTTVYALYGSTLVLSVGETGELPFTNQWYFGSTPLSDNAHIIGSHSNVLTIVNVTTSDAGNYQMVVTNANGSGVSQVAALSVVDTLNFNDGLGWNLNGNPLFTSSNSIEMTDNNGNEARSLWFDSQVYVTAFKASWIYQLTSTNNPADGTAFVVQDSPAGIAALGNGGGAIGFGGPDGSTTAGITPSVALGMNVYNGHAIGIHVFTDGLGANSTGGANYDLTTPVSLTSRDPIQFNVTYVPGTMHVQMSDLATNLTFATNYTVNVPNTLGTNLGYVGFTAGTGGVASSQVVSNFTFVSLGVLSINVSGPNLIVSWPPVDGHYILQQNSAINGSHPWTTVGAPVTQVNGVNQVSVPLPSSPAYYRLQLQ